MRTGRAERSAQGTAHPSPPGFLPETGRERRIFRCPNPVFAAGILLALLLAPRPGHPGDEPFRSPSNSGLTGLYEIPSARTMPRDHLRAGFSKVDPYRYYYLGVGLFDWLELNGRLTEVSGVPGISADVNYGDTKDKAFDLKVRLLNEGKYFPALALVVMDPHGSRVYSSQSIVASKQIYPFDFTVGMGNGRFGDRPLPPSGEGIDLEILTDPDDWWKESRVFGGIQFALRDRLLLTAEYSPIPYHRQSRDPAQRKYFTEPVPSRLNYGMTVRPVSWARVDLSWQRGDTLSLGFSVDLDMSRPIVPVYDPPYREPADSRNLPLEDRITRALAASGFRDIRVREDGWTVEVEAENVRYFFTPTAVDAAAEAIGRLIPEAIASVRVVITEDRIPVVSTSVTGAAARAFAAGALPEKAWLGLTAFSTGRIRPVEGRLRERRWARFDIAPALETYLNDPGKFFSYRFGLAASLRLFPWQGATLLAQADWYPVNNVSSLNVPLSIPVRSDSPLYKEQELSLARLQLEQVGRFGRRLFLRGAGGYLETMYAGVDGEGAIPLFRGRVYLGAGGSWVRKRDPDSVFGLAHAEYHTLLGRARINLPEWDLWADISGGRFLAGDPGVRLSLSKFIRGWTLSAWYSITDTSVFSDPYNRGYHDKGISIAIPLRHFIGRDSRTTYEYSLSAWTRDVGADVDRNRSLFDFIGRNVPIYLDRDRAGFGTMER